MTMPTWISEVQAFSIPAITGAAGFIAWQQYRISKQKLRYELYEKRYEIYETFLNSIITALNQNVEDVFDTTTQKLGQKLREARFLLDQQTFIYLNNLESEILRYRFGTTVIRKSDFHSWAESQAFILKNHEAGSKLLECMTSLPKVMSPFLAIDDSFSLIFARTSEVDNIKVP